MTKNVYEGVEDLNNFTSEIEILDYRKNIVINNKLLVRFLMEYINFNNSDVILDVGSGNCGLLISLDSQLDFKKAIGLEPAKTRFEFSERWLVDQNISKIKVRNELFDSNFELNEKPSKLLLLDNTFLVIAGQKNNDYEGILEDVKRNLSSQGDLLLEFLLIEEFIHWSKEVDLTVDSRFSRTEYNMSFSSDKKTIISSSKRFLKDSDEFLYKEDILSCIESDEIIKSLARLDFNIVNTFKSLPWVSEGLPRRILIHAKLS